VCPPKVRIADDTPGIGIYPSWMREPADIKSPRTPQNTRTGQKVSALTVGFVTALLTLGLENSWFVSHLGAAWVVFTAVLFPGLLASMAIAGNAHAFSSWIAAAFNGILYCILIWAAWSLTSAIARKSLGILAALGFFVLVISVVLGINEYQTVHSNLPFSGMLQPEAWTVVTILSAVGLCAIGYSLWTWLRRMR